MPPSKDASKASSKASSKAAQKTSSKASSKGSTKGSSKESSKPTSKVASKVASKTTSKAESGTSSVVPPATPSQAESVIVSTAPMVPVLAEDDDSPENMAMQELRNLQHGAAGNSPVSQLDSDVTRGRHVQSMLAACLGPCTAGTTLGFASSAMASIERESWYDLEHRTPQNRWAADVLLIGAAVGALLSGLPLWFLGSRTTLLVCALGLSFSWAVLAASPHLYVLLGARVACGVCLGVTTIGASLYVVDVAPGEKRVLYGGLAEVGTSAGILVSYLLSFFPWRLQAAACAGVSLTMLYAQRVIIESPRWLLARQRRYEAMAAAASLYGFHVPPDLRPGTRTPDPLAPPPPPPPCAPRARSLLLCLLVQLLRESTCAELVLYRAIQTMDGIVVEVTPPVAAVVIAALHVAAVTAVASLTRTAGLWHLLFASTLLVAFCVAFLPPFEYLVLRRWALADSPAEVSSIGWGVVYSVNLLVLGYSVGLCHLPPLVTAELCWAPGCTLRYVVAPVAWSVRWLLVLALLHFDDTLAELARFKAVPPTVAIAMLLLAVFLAATVPGTKKRDEGSP